MKHSFLALYTIFSLSLASHAAEPLEPNEPADINGDIKSSVAKEPPKSPAPPDALESEEVEAKMEPAENSKTLEETKPSKTAKRPPTSSDTNAKMKTSGILGPVLVGPTVFTLSVPALVGFGLEGKFSDIAGFSADYGIIPKLNFSDVSLQAHNWKVAARVFPFHQSFFIGLAYGQQTIEGSGSKTISGQTVTATAKVKTDFLTPMIGWRWLWNSGFFMGLDLGAQLALDANTTFTTDAPAATQATTEYRNLERDVRDAGDKIGEQTLPHITLLQIGFLF